MAERDADAAPGGEDPRPSAVTFVTTEHFHPGLLRLRPEGGLVERRHRLSGERDMPAARGAVSGSALAASGADLIVNAVGRRRLDGRCARR
jgi:hypothetical protein